MPRATINGLTLYYDHTCFAPWWAEEQIPVVVIHGLGTDHTIWSSQVSALAQHRPVIALDTRGHGRSDKPVAEVYSIETHADDVAALLRHLEYRQAHVVGTSMGGIIAQQVALRHPEVVRSLVLVCTFCEPPKERNLEWRLGRFDAAPDLQTFYSGTLRSSLGPDASDEAVNFLMELEVRNPRDVHRIEMVATFTYHGCDLVSQIKAPALVVGAKDDGSIPAYLSEQIASKLPNGRLTLIPNCGHAPYLETPDELNRILIEWVQAQSAVGV